MRCERCDKILGIWPTCHCRPFEVIEWCVHPAFGDANTIEERRRTVHAEGQEAAAERYARERFDALESITQHLYLQIGDEFYTSDAVVTPQFEVKRVRPRDARGRRHD